MIAYYNLIVCEETVLDQDGEEEGEPDSPASVTATACPLRLHIAPYVCDKCLNACHCLRCRIRQRMLCHTCVTVA